MSAPSVQRPRVIRRKLMVPDTPVGAVSRERLDALLCQLVDTHRVVVVTATAGAGKSVAVADASRKFDRPVAWLSVDATDAAPGRLVTYLEEALAQQAALGAGNSHRRAGRRHPACRGGGPARRRGRRRRRRVCSRRSGAAARIAASVGGDRLGRALRPPKHEADSDQPPPTGCFDLVPRTGRRGGTTRRRGPGVHGGGGAHRPAEIGPPGGRRTGGRGGHGRLGDRSAF